MKKLLNVIFVLLIFLTLWLSGIYFFAIPKYIFPSPFDVVKAFIRHYPLLWHESLITFFEIIAGFLGGMIIGMSFAVLMLLSKRLRAVSMPILLISQAMPTFAIAPLLILWFGYGLISKIIMIVIMVFFPIASALYDGLSRTPNSLLALAKTMQAKPSQTLWLIRFPYALPFLASGLRIASVITPLGAIVGEWVGASHGLGYLLISSNATMQIDLLFADLAIIILFCLLLFTLTDRALKKIIFWQEM